MQILFWNAYYSSVSVIIIYTMPLYGCSNQARGSYRVPFFFFLCRLQRQLYCRLPTEWSVKQSRAVASFSCNYLYSGCVWCCSHHQSRQAHRSSGWSGRRRWAMREACCLHSVVKCAGSQPAVHPGAGCVVQSACCYRHTQRCAEPPDLVKSPKDETRGHIKYLIISPEKQ